MEKLKIGLIFGGRSEEHEISIMSARSIYSVIDRNKYEIKPFAISKNGYCLDSEESLKVLENQNISVLIKDELLSLASSFKPIIESNIDLAFPILHGPFGEDGRLQGMLEILDIPYVGTGVLSSAVGMDKAIMKNLFANNNIPQGRYKIVYKYDINDIKKLQKEVKSDIAWPCFIKPANMGSSIGITKVNKAEELGLALEEAFKYDYKAVVEEYIPGREVECSVLGNTNIQVSLPGEIKSNNDFYDYKAKYQDNSTELIIPANLSDKVINDIKTISREAFRAVDAHGFARVDFFITKKDEVLVNEVNTIPGFTRYSMYPKLWEVSGLPYKNLIDRLIELALEWNEIIKT
ncbi:D-alanine--D-alanine ligase family protein [Natronospora cellulosivora (SeqCode)]